MAGDMELTFLGTSSGGGPTRPRNCSSLVCNLLRDGSLWSTAFNSNHNIHPYSVNPVIDCAEGTIRQFQFLPQDCPNVKATKVTKLFITHMHADHIMGIIMFLRSVLYPPPVSSTAHGQSRSRTVEIYGPAGLRSFVRQNFKMTYTHTADYYVVHELLTSKDRITPCNNLMPSQAGALGTPIGFQDWEVMHHSEKRGRDIYPDEDNFWRGIATGEGRFGKIIVDAGPIFHRDPCIGYVFRENADSQRKIVVLGDTSDPSAIIPLCINPSPSLLIHEATDAHIPYHIDVKLGRRDEEEVLSRTLSRGHSSPGMAGAFARLVDAQGLVLNHIGARFPGPTEDRGHRNWRILTEIQSQASQAWGSGRQAKVASDFMRIIIPYGRDPNSQEQYSLGRDIRFSHGSQSLSIRQSTPSYRQQRTLDGDRSRGDCQYQWKSQR